MELSGLLLLATATIAASESNITMSPSVQPSYSTAVTSMSSSVLPTEGTFPSSSSMIGSTTVSLLSSGYINTLPASSPPTNSSLSVSTVTSTVTSMSSSITDSLTLNHTPIRSTSITATTISDADWSNSASINQSSQLEHPQVLSSSSVGQRQRESSEWTTSSVSTDTMFSNSSNVVTTSVLSNMQSLSSTSASPLGTGSIDSIRLTTSYLFVPSSSLALVPSIRNNASSALDSSSFDSISASNARVSLSIDSNIASTARVSSTIGSTSASHVHVSPSVTHVSNVPSVITTPVRVASNTLIMPSTASVFIDSFTTSKSSILPSTALWYPDWDVMYDLNLTLLSTPSMPTRATQLVDSVTASNGGLLSSTAVGLVDSVTTNVSASDSSSIFSTNGTILAVTSPPLSVSDSSSTYLQSSKSSMLASENVSSTATATIHSGMVSKATHLDGSLLTTFSSYPIIGNDTVSASSTIYVSPTRSFILSTMPSATLVIQSDIPALSPSESGSIYQTFASVSGPVSTTTVVDQSIASIQSFGSIFSFADSFAGISTSSLPQTTSKYLSTDLPVSTSYSIVQTYGVESSSLLQIVNPSPISTPASASVFPTKNTSSEQTNTFRVMLSFTGTCDLLENSKILQLEFWQTLVAVINATTFTITTINNIEDVDLKCDPFYVVLVMRNISKSAFLCNMSSSISDSRLNFKIIDDTMPLTFKATGIRILPQDSEENDVEKLELGLEPTDIAIIAIAAFLFAVLIFAVGIFICWEWRKRKRAASFNLLSASHSNLKMEEFTLTRIPRPQMIYHENSSILPATAISSNGRHKRHRLQEEKSLEERKSTCSDNIHIRMHDHEDGLVVGVTCSPPASPSRESSSNSGSTRSYGTNQSKQALIKGDKSNGAMSNPNYHVTEVPAERSHELIQDDENEQLL